MTPSGRMTVVLGFRDLIDGQEALLIAIINIHTCFIDVEEQAKYRQRPCLNAGFYDVVCHQVVQLLDDIDQSNSNNFRAVWIMYALQQLASLITATYGLQNPEFEG